MSCSLSFACSVSSISGAGGCLAKCHQTTCINFDLNSKRRYDPGPIETIPGTSRYKIAYAGAPPFSPGLQGSPPQAQRPRVNPGLIRFPPCVGRIVDKCRPAAINFQIIT
ncbi:hypothetical protein B0H12DRAFT_1137968 [Mycena haematopus]|nr:hypothetical protein B0H12DRAFT_1137968 [Mycena haematopus]